MRKKIGRPREYRDKRHLATAENARDWYARNRERVLKRLRDDRKANPEKYRARDRARYEKHREKRGALAKKWRRENWQKYLDANAAWIARNPEARAAHTALSNALRDGLVSRKPCQVCAKKRVQAHHKNYSKPLEVRWLCAVHHAELHKKRRITSNRGRA